MEVVKTWQMKLVNGSKEVAHNLKVLAQDAKKMGWKRLGQAIWADLFLGRSRNEWLYLIALSLVPIIVTLTNPESDFLGFITSLTGVLNVIYVAEGRKSNYLFGLITTVIYLYLALQRNFYGEVATTTYFVLMQPIGLYVWLMADRQKTTTTEPTEFKAKRLSLKGWVIALAQTAAVWLLMGLAYQTIHSARPFRDSVTDGTNVIGQKLMTELYVEQWVFWIATNLFSIYLWWGATIDIQVMYLLYTVNSIVGMVRWMKQAELNRA